MHTASRDWHTRCAARDATPHSVIASALNMCRVNCSPQLTRTTLHYTCTFLHSAHNKRVMNFLDTANTTRVPRASNRFSYTLRASPSLFFALEFSTGSTSMATFVLPVALALQLTPCTVSCSRRIVNSNRTEQYCSVRFASRSRSSARSEASSRRR